MSFSGVRLRVARTFQGWTQRELAERVAVSNGLVAALENGTKQPGPEILAALCAELGVHRSYFEALRTDEFQEDESNFRKRITAPEKMRRQVLAQASMFGMVVGHLRTFGEFPALNFPDCPVQALEEIEFVSQRCRTLWNIPTDAPIGDMARVIENAGAIILNIDLETAKKVDAFSRFGENSVVVLNTEKESPSRTLFSLAHEAGHGVLHRKARSMPIDRKEEEADYFAGAFLLPREAFIADFMANRALDWEGLLDMKRYWRTSVQAIIRRAYQLQLISAAEYRQRFRRLSFWGWRKEEPDEPSLDQPLLLQEALRRAYQDYGKTPAALADDLGLSRQMFEKATGVPIDDGSITKVFSLTERRRMNGA